MAHSRIDVQRPQLGDEVRLDIDSEANLANGTTNRNGRLLKR
jgi:hypothetical protein